MRKYRYTNTGTTELSIAGLGVVGAGETVDTDIHIENPNFRLEEVKSSEKSNIIEEPTKDATPRNKRK